MERDPVLYEEEASPVIDPDITPIRDRKLVTQPYDLVIESLVSQIRNKTLYLRPVADRPKFQRKYVWPDKLASRLVESILLNVPIPPCYLSQNEDFELDVIDGQQRIYSIYRYVNNEFALSDLEVLTEINGMRFHELAERSQKKILTHTLRCVIVTNDSHPEIKFNVFERLNTNTVPLNPQELRNCIERGALNDLLGELVLYEPWLRILGRKTPDKRMRDEELVLRFFAFHVNGSDTYKTPLKTWLNDVAREGKRYPPSKIAELATTWRNTIDKCLIVFPAKECFRRIPLGRSKVINRALMDLTMHSVQKMDMETVGRVRRQYYQRYVSVIANQEFAALISKSVDHVKRTKRRFEIWQESVDQGLE